MWSGLSTQVGAAVAIALPVSTHHGDHGELTRLAACGAKAAAAELCRWGSKVD